MPSNSASSSLSATDILVCDKARALQRFARQPDVLGHRHLWYQAQLLKDRGDADVFGGMWRREMDGASIKE
jgi:hypothetical protein